MHSNYLNFGVTSKLNKLLHSSHRKHFQNVENRPNYPKSLARDLPLELNQITFLKKVCLVLLKANVEAKKIGQLRGLFCSLPVNLCFSIHIFAIRMLGVSLELHFKKSHGMSEDKFSMNQVHFCFTCIFAFNFKTMMKLYYFGGQTKPSII